MSCCIGEGLSCGKNISTRFAMILVSIRYVLLSTALMALAIARSNWLAIVEEAIESAQIGAGDEEEDQKESPGWSSPSNKLIL